MTENAQPVQIEQEIKTIKLGDTSYDAASVTDLGNQLLQDLQKIEGLLGHQQLSVSVTSLARAKIIEELEKESSNFTVVPEAANSEE